MKRYLCFILLQGSLILYCMGQSRPQWIQSPPKKAETYYYRVSHGTGLTEEAALKKALALTIMESAFAVGVSVDVHKLEKMDGDSMMIEAEKYVKIPINKVCQYTEELITRRGYRVYVLCQVANDVHIIPDFRTFNCTSNKEE